MHVLSFLTKQLPITRHTETTGGTILTLPIYTTRSYVQSLRNVVSVPADKHKIYIHFWTLRASTHERPPCVLRHTGNAYAASPYIHTYITIHYRDGTQTFDAEWAALHTSQQLTGHPRVDMSQGSRSWPTA